MAILRLKKLKNQNTDLKFFRAVSKRSLMSPSKFKIDSFKFFENEQWALNLTQKRPETRVSNLPRQNLN
jgi:hypothetical protein